MNSIVLLSILLLVMNFSVPVASAQEGESSAQGSITIDTISAAETIIGLTFTESERALMQRGLNENLDHFNTIRNYEIDNSVPPAFLFNPIPVGMRFEREKRPFVVSPVGDVRLPERRDDLAYYTVPELAKLIRIRAITSVELTSFFLERLKKYNEKLHCVISFTEELAYKQAKRADEELAQGTYRGLLHGIPYGIKDLFSVKEYKTTWGARPYRDQIIYQDAAVVKKLEEAGAVLIAKLTLGALAYGDVWFGEKTRNPWNLEQGSSGSSAGSAAAVSAGLVPFAIGTETWGSIVSPSTRCGVTGLRPTFGRVSRTGAMALSWTMDKIGPICRTVEDCAIVFNAIHGSDGIDPTAIDLPFNYTPYTDIRTLRIGYLHREFERDYKFKTNDLAVIERFKAMGIELLPIELPDIPANAISFILNVEAAAAFDELTRSNRDDLLVSQERHSWPNLFRTHRFVPAVEYIQASRIRYQLVQAMHQLMLDIDVYLAPTWEGGNLLVTNLTGHPSISVPNGFDENDSPTSITFTGQLFGEANLLAVAKAFQDATEFHRKRPPVEEDKTEQNPQQD